MDTKRALIVIMVLLILMNIALASYIIVLGNRSAQDIETGDYTVEILSQRNITVNCRIPAEIPRTGKIILGGMRFGRNSIAVLEAATGGTYDIDDEGNLIYTALQGDVTESGDFGRTEVELATREFMEKIGLYKDEFVLDMIIETGNDIYDVRYLNIDETGIIIFDSYIEMNVTPGGVSWAEISVADVSDRNMGENDGLPVGTIMLTHLVSEGKESVIEEIKSGYHKVGEITNESTMSWRIRFADGRERFFAIDTGIEITPIKDILGFNNIKLECSLPETPAAYPGITYGDSVFDNQDIAMMQTLIGPGISIDENDIVTFGLLGEGETSYNLTDSLVLELGSMFIEKTGLDQDDYRLESLIENEDGSYDSLYVYIDRNGMIHYDNYISLHLTEAGITIAEFRENSYEADSGAIPAGNSIGTILFNNLDTEDGREYIITKIEAGYLRVPEDSSDAPAFWKVTFDDSETRWYYAANGSMFEPDE